AMTMAGVILGTAAYMSPEQAKGRAADKRSDIWAFGCVLYEMLTGRRAFEGEDVTDILANVLKEAPDWTKLPADTSAPIHRLLRRCLQKDRGSDCRTSAARGSKSRTLWAARRSRRRRWRGPVESRWRGRWLRLPQSRSSSRSGRRGERHRAQQ